MSEKNKESEKAKTTQEASGSVVEEDEVDGVTMVDVLKEEEALEEDAAAVLGKILINSEVKCGQN